MRTVLLALCLLLAAVILAEWFFWPAKPNLVNKINSVRNEMATTESELKSVDGFTLPPLTEFESIIERPLFIEGRRPLPPVETAVQDEKPFPERGSLRPPRVDLSAILIIKDEPMALLRNPPKGVSARLKKGDEFQGWQVEEITPDRVTLTQGDKREEFLLREFKKIPLPNVSKTKNRPQINTRSQINQRVRRQPRRPPAEMDEDELEELEEMEDEEG